MAIVFSGSRYGMTDLQGTVLYERLWSTATEAYPSNVEANIISLHHGMSGKSDNRAQYYARRCHYYIIGHPCNIEKYRINVTVDELREMKDPLTRNQDMIDEALTDHLFPSLLIATPNVDIKPDGKLGGTWSTICRSVNSGLPIEIIQLNGKIREEI